MRELEVNVGDVIFRKFKELWELFFLNDRKPVTMCFNGVRIIIFDDN